MSDLLLLATWSAVLAAGLAFAVQLRRFGLATTYVRDLIHVGASVWVFGWRYWESAAAMMALPLCALAMVLILPMIASRSRIARGIVESMSNGEERWAGIVAYVLAYAIFTGVALVADRFTAACALLSLSWGDGIGGLVGRRFGRHFYRVPWGKKKSIEGSLAVACFAFLGALAAALCYGAGPAPVTLLAMIAVALAASISEAIAPRASDNLAVPFAVLFAGLIFS